MKVCEKVRKMCGQLEVSTRETCGSRYGASLSEVQNKESSNFKMYVPCTFIEILSTSWINTIYFHIHSSYTCTVKLRQHHRPKNTAITSCVSCHAHIAIFHVPPSARAVYVTPLMYVLNSSVLQGGNKI
jgi:hypothetical protein